MGKKQSMQQLLIEVAVIEAKKNPERLATMEIGFVIGLATGSRQTKLLLHRGILSALRKMQNPDSGASSNLIINGIFDSLKNLPNTLESMDLCDVLQIWKSIDEQLDAIVDEATKLTAKS